MTQFPLYNPLQFSKSFPKYDHEIYDCFLQKFLKDTQLVGYFRTNKLIQSVNIFRVDTQKTRIAGTTTFLYSTSGLSYYRFVATLPSEKGLYYARITVDNIAYFSNVFEILKTQPQRGLLSLQAYDNDRRNTLLSQNPTPTINVEFESKDTTDLRTDSTQYEMSHGRKIVLDGETYNVRTFHFGGKTGVSRYLANAIKTWLYCDVVEIDGERYRIVNEPEFVTLDNYDLITVKCEMVKDVSGFGMWTDGNADKPVADLPIVRDWILATGRWNDNGIWMDSAIWMD